MSYYRGLPRSYDSWRTSGPPEPLEPPEEAYHAACQGEGCEGCDNGIDRDWMRAAAAAEREADEALYEAYLESREGWPEEDY